MTDKTEQKSKSTVSSHSSDSKGDDKVHSSGDHPSVLRQGSQLRGFPTTNEPAEDQKRRSVTMEDASDVPRPLSPFGQGEGIVSVNMAPTTSRPLGSRAQETASLGATTDSATDRVSQPSKGTGSRGGKRVVGARAPDLIQRPMAGSSNMPAAQSARPTLPPISHLAGPSTSAPIVPIAHQPQVPQQQVQLPELWAVIAAYYSSAFEDKQVQIFGLHSRFEVAQQMAIRVAQQYFSATQTKVVYDGSFGSHAIGDVITSERGTPVVKVARAKIYG